jgi:hypothetical protein
MDFILFVFGKHKNQEQFVDVVCDNLSQSIRPENIKYYYGDESLIITFNSGKNFSEIKDLVGKIFDNKNIEYILLPYTTDNMSVGMNADVYNNLFTNETYTDNSVIFDITPNANQDEFLEIFKDIFEEYDNVTLTRLKPKQKTLNEILDRIIEVGFDNLTQDEKDQLSKYSKL